MRRLLRITSLFFGIFFAVITIFSCKTAKKAAEIRLKPLNAARIMKILNERETGFDKLSIKRISCQFSNSKTSATFKASLKLIRDEKILISFSKLNIPVGRILLTPRNVKYVNYIERNYYDGSYGFLNDIFNLSVDFQDIQSIIFNNFFSYFNFSNEGEPENFDAFTESGLYVLQSINSKRLLKFYEKFKKEKAEKYLKKKKEDALVVQTVYIEPVQFNILKLIFEDRTSKSIIEFNFDEFTQVDGKNYPGIVKMLFDMPEEKVQLFINMNGFSTTEEGDFDLKIPERYSAINWK